MTHILICHNAADRLQAAAVWLGQEFVRNHDDAEIKTIIYISTPSLADQLDQLLWSTPPSGFLPHCRAHSPLAAETPLIIAQSANELENIPHSARLLNLDNTLPPHFERYTHLIEIISQEEKTRQAGRERVRHYREHGHDIQYRDLQKEPL
jgi:DNA polymerase-3 subunit chi